VAPGASVATDVVSPLAIALGGLYVLTLLGLLVYASNAYVMVALHWRHRRDRAAPAPLPDPLPVVTVQLPLFNERYVARRLLEAVAALDYPRDRLEVQVLDDSTDDTPEIVAALVARLRAGGLDVVHRRRAVRTGFKAGALADGLATARGEFIAIFDADFVPLPDFLRATLACFRPDVAVVQGRWGHLNRGFSLLTVAQSLGIDGHFGVEQAARARSGLFLNFNGTAGVWRRAAIEDAGGWTHDTLTEDLDLSYRAQLRGWKIVYRPEIVCPAELPVLVSGFKSQQRRWAQGSMQTALKLLPAVWRAPLPRWTKYQASVHLTYYLIHPLMLAGVALALPLRALAPTPPAAGWQELAGLIFALATLGPGTMLAYGQRALGEPSWRRLLELPTIMVVGVGVALSTSRAVLGAFISGGREFVRTPKFGIAGRSGTWRDKRYLGGEPRGGLAELALGAYCAGATWLMWSDGQYTVAPFLALYTAGFLTVGWLTVSQAWRLPRLRPRRVAAGAALAFALGSARAAPTEPASDPLAAEGERWWTRSPDPGNPVACATCHHDGVATAAWAAGFPKWKPMPPPHARVMTLYQVNAEAVARHYRLEDPRPAASAITAYLTRQAGDAPVTPGISAGQPVFLARLRALRVSAARGRRLFERECRACHDPASAAGRLPAFPRVSDGRAQAVEDFVEAHMPGGRGLSWDSSFMADLLAYLTGERAGQPVGPPGVSRAREVVP
jgi:Glycosyltransferase like family 2